ncbi:hypothetical protein CMI47_00190 [Candidatus Pacearchaeota archaeon]|nr:hypothetical protein [Candidatus Pacearchaeota archaeon]|tara:strand:+ start:19282 stop:20874 length:1593 start_codon:yes stop_codon:yes gene_type:complete
MEKDEKKKRMDAIRQIYYSNPKVQEVLLKFAVDREVVPSYMGEAFGKRPDTIQYPSDLNGLVKKGATSLHCSEEIWNNPLELNSDMGEGEMDALRKNWDLLIDIDSPYLDYSKIALRLIIGALESHGVKNYGIKFSGSKGFHLIVSGNAFPEEYEGFKTRAQFPEWPRAICRYLMASIKKDYNREVGKEEINFEAVKERTNLSKEDLTQIVCPECGKTGEKGSLVIFECEECKTKIERPNHKITKKKLMCINPDCPGIFGVVDEQEMFSCSNCGYSSHSKMSTESGDRTVVYSKEAREAKYSEDFSEEVSGEMLGGLDLVLVAPRHLFRMPYSLHEKTGLASIVLTKTEIDGFVPKMADPMKIEIKDFYPKNEVGEGQRLLAAALSWKKMDDDHEEREGRKKYEGKKYDDVKIVGVTAEMFPKAIKKLLKGVSDGRKRGLFVLLTFLKSIEWSPEKINETVRDWNKRNSPGLKEGYLRAQVDWHLKQKKKILPPNYANDAFYRDIGILDENPKEKNPIVEVVRKVKGWKK